MTYEKYIGMSRDELLQKLKSLMSEKRFKHVLGVEKAARELAEAHSYDKEKAGLAGLLHDYAKEVSDQTFLNLIDKYELNPKLKDWNNNIWHGVVGIYKIQEELGLSDMDILSAIEHHTIGSANMTILEKIVYVADYIEDNRDFPGVNEARLIAKASLDKAVAYETASTVAFLASKAQPIYPKTLETYNAYVHYLNEE